MILSGTSVLTAMVQNLGVRSCHGKSISFHFHTLALSSTQIRKSILAVFSLHKGNSAGKEPMKKSSNSFLSYNRPDFISPNTLQGLVFQVTVGFQSSTHITYSNQRECSKAQISSLQVSFPNCFQIDFSKTHTHLFDKHIYSCY